MAKEQRQPTKVESSLKKATGIGPGRAISPSRSLLKDFTGYPLPGEEFNKTDMFMKLAPAVLPFIGKAAGIGSQIAERALPSLAPTFGRDTTGPIVRGMRVNQIPEELAIKDLGAHLKGLKPHSVQPTEGLTEMQRWALNHEAPPDVAWRGLDRVRKAIGF